MSTSSNKRDNIGVDIAGPSTTYTPQDYYVSQPSQQDDWFHSAPYMPSHTKSYSAHIDLDLGLDINKSYAPEYSISPIVSGSRPRKEHKIFPLISKEEKVEVHNPQNHGREPRIHQFGPSQRICSHILQKPTLMQSDQEIKDTIFSIDKDSVAGPNGFSSAFYQTCWELIATDINKAVNDFFCGTPMPRNFTATTIVLILKVDSP
ncbi:UNVERIFIED_CONTAM: hypothetical protein Slati_1510700 [Sesamum latifolium]|uniref:Reverse transcriptase n=1 Tax=Sesamum latifolium TaxID=2727402 RepID=A0AAW2X6Z2_9LAMI